ncbi:hypothetical protein EVAR_61065_1 [Eumeta japonica]|uniref:Uncharacterized protein n=1 Tax=Eumeta variegata TaxID=151549 RepID=A0A4C1Z4F1_EUMVA|nr:hypothetical protein EVAR_61065_1 [Eumeta japonica]
MDLSEMKRQSDASARVRPPRGAPELFRRLFLSRASLGFELLLAIKHHARRLFIIGLQNSSALTSISVTNLVIVALHRCEQKTHRFVRRMIEIDRHVIYHEIRAS